MTRKIREEAAEETLRVRKEAAAKIEGLREEALRVLPELQAEEDRAREAIKAHDERRKVLEGELARAWTARTKERQRFEWETAAAERILFESYSEKIDEAITFFLDKFDALRRKKAVYDTQGGEVNVLTLTKKSTFTSNARAIEAALRYCLGAIGEIESMKLSLEVDAERIEALKAGIPDADAMREITVEKPLPPVAPNPRLLFPSDEQQAWSLGKLNQKIHKVMGW